MRSFIAVIIGAAVMIAISAIGLAVAFQSLGAEFAFEKGSWLPSIMWTAAIAIPLGILAAVFGGLICSIIAKAPGTRPPLVFAMIFLLFGLGTAMLGIMSADQEKENTSIVKDLTASARSAAIELEKKDLTTMDAGKKFNKFKPLWYDFATTLCGFFGILYGARMGRKFRGPAKA
ncbi:MAG: hypothetical protein V3W41_18110 [Planctomycetota bacterium]